MFATIRNDPIWAESADIALGQVNVSLAGRNQTAGPNPREIVLELRGMLERTPPASDAEVINRFQELMQIEDAVPAGTALVEEENGNGQ